MSLRDEQNRVQKSMNAALSGLQEDPWLTQRVFANVKGEEQVTKKRISALALVVILAVAVIGTACAVFPTQIANLFKQNWSWEEGEKLEEGKVAQVGESVTAGGVVFTLEEIAYKDQALYGVVNMRPADEKDVFIPETMLWDMENGAADWLTKEKFEKTLEQAKTSGGRILSGMVLIDAIGVDKGTMLETGCESNTKWNYDGSATYLFMVTNGFIVNDGTSYQIRMRYYGSQADEKGTIIDESRESALQTVSCVPVAAETDKPAEPEATVSAEDLKGYEVVTPAAYRETGTLPVCRAVANDLKAAVDPAWFNTSGILEDDGKGNITFNDHAMLSAEKSWLWYDEEGELEDRETTAWNIVSLANCRGLEKSEEVYAGQFNPETEELKGITLEEAKRQTEELITRLGLDCNGYTCSYELDMSLDRIRRLGAIDNAYWSNQQDVYPQVVKLFDYEAVPETEEGFYLEYTPTEVDSEDSYEDYNIRVYVTGNGIAYFDVLNEFSKGEIAYTPEKLISAEDAVQRLTQEVSRLRNGAEKEVTSVRKAVLNYEAVRADNKADGMVFVPTWTVLYAGPDYVEDDEVYSLSYAVFNAVDGSLISSGADNR